MKTNIKEGDKVLCIKDFHCTVNGTKHDIVLFEKNKHYIVTAVINNYRRVNISYNNGSNRFIEQFNFYTKSYASKMYIQHLRFENYFITNKQNRKLKLNKLNEI
jgi:hypothetical protein